RRGLSAPHSAARIRGRYDESEPTDAKHFSPRGPGRCVCLQRHLARVRAVRLRAPARGGLSATPSLPPRAIARIPPMSHDSHFPRPVMPENLARTAAAPGLSAAERRVLNQIRGHEYLVIFGLVEEFILPFVLDHARPQLNGDDARVRALLGFASEEAKHIDLFKRFHARFVEGFGSACATIGPPERSAPKCCGTTRSRWRW